ncbi:TPA: hypothetical protein ACXDAZ_002249 [Clostridium botulinum]|uniref:hypothetical protein n=1 Tax=Clostridium botulinum TaxID=1491 RepID=UPI0008FC4C9D|nr:hypothetical protein [Clostridium botulinum]APC79664.1 HD domain protein [Clostridium botulinum]MCS4449150.1 hypothetical protein [Clostridium botulinum]MCS4459075.1 hypothetical protein [Clostridium botulinum]MCS4462462.1 hypothetical protein [Clostridium botulinum]MCS4512214.1 hypothetical protein [Clostridium botulinum]
MKVKCIKSFTAEHCDDNGFSIENLELTIEKGTIWEVEEDPFRFTGGEIRLTKITDDDSWEWLEIPKEWFKESFQAITDNQVFIIKVRNIKEIKEEILCGYINEKDAKDHVKAYKEIYAKDLKSIIWYEPVNIKNNFN